MAELNLSGTLFMKKKKRKKKQESVFTWGKDCRLPPPQRLPLSTHLEPHVMSYSPPKAFFGRPWNNTSGLPTKNGSTVTAFQRRRTWRTAFLTLGRVSKAAVHDSGSMVGAAPFGLSHEGTFPPWVISRDTTDGSCRPLLLMCFPAVQFEELKFWTQRWSQSAPPSAFLHLVFCGMILLLEPSHTISSTSSFCGTSWPWHNMARIVLWMMEAELCIILPCCDGMVACARCPFVPFQHDDSWIWANAMCFIVLRK